MAARDPFAPVDMEVEYVDSAAGSRKTLTAIAVALDAAKRRNAKTIFAMPTLELVREMVEFAHRDKTVPAVEITSRDNKSTVVEALRRHISGRDYKGNPIRNHITGGHLVFITHEALHRMSFWPPETSEFDLIIDEAPEVILSRRPFRLRDSAWVLTSFLEVHNAKISPAMRRAQAQARKDGRPVFTERDARHLLHMQAVIRPAANASPGEVEQAKEHIARLEQKRIDAGGDPESDNPIRDALMPYYSIAPKMNDNAQDPWVWIKNRIYYKDRDEVYDLIDPIPQWLAQEASLFTDMLAWERMTERDPNDRQHDRGLVTITGFRRPDMLRHFKSATIMSALFEYTMVYAVWSPLGVRFVPSRSIRVNVPTTPLGHRKLRMFWLTDQGWSKRSREKAGGINQIFDLIVKSGAIDHTAEVCVCTNKDDASEDDPRIVRQHFPRAIMMPHNSRGQNRFRGYHHLIHTAALNSYTPDIRWLETVLGIDSRTQRIARCGQEVYQTMMRLSLREPTSTMPVDVVVMDKDVAEWLVQWFSPQDQVELVEIDSSAVIRPKGKAGRPLLGAEPMTAAERQRRRRQRRRDNPDAPAAG